MERRFGGCRLAVPGRHLPNTVCSDVFMFLLAGVGGFPSVQE